MNEAERYLEEKSRTATSIIRPDGINGASYAEQSSEIKRDGQEPIPPLSENPAGTPKQKGFAIASLVCAILGGYASTLTIPAIICGHLALYKMKKSPKIYSGKGLAIAGLIIGYAGLILALVLGAVRAKNNDMLERYHQSLRGN